MGRLFLATLALATGLAVAAGPEPLAGPGPRDTCPVCGMLVAKYPNWIAQVRYGDGHAHYFDGAKDMFKYLQALPKYAPGHRTADIKTIQVTEFYGLTRMDARKAWYVIGSDVYGPMGHEFVALASRADAEEFQRDHKGRRILSYEQVNPAVVAEVDEGRFK